MVKESESDGPELQQVAEGERPDRHPLFGALKGSVFVPAGVDLTEPADPDWVHERPDRR